MNSNSRLSLSLSSLICTALFAQESTSLKHSDMTMMMQKIQEIQTCISQIDFNKLSSMQKETLRVKMDIKAMCAQGKREQADKEAKLFYDKVMRLPAVIQMKACTQGLIPEFDPKESIHVCDAEQMDFGIPDIQRINW